MSDETTTETDAPRTCAECRFSAPYTFTPPVNPDSPGNLYCSFDNVVKSVGQSYSCENYKEPDRA